VEEVGDVLAGVAEALDGDADLRRVPAPTLLQHLDGVVGAAAGGVVAPEAAAEVQGLAGDHRRGALAAVLGVLVHHPAHDHGVGVDVGRRDVGLGADEVGPCADEAPAESLELQLGQRLGVDGDAALAAAEGDAHHRALERHPEGQRLDLVDRDVGVVADAALGRGRGCRRGGPGSPRRFAATRRPCAPGSRPA
jgi:hypothetical protein